MNYFLLRRARAAGLTNPELYLNFPLSRVSGIKTRERFTCSSPTFSVSSAILLSSHLREEESIIYFLLLILKV